MYKEEKLICPKCGALLAIKKGSQIHIKGSKSEVFVEDNQTYIICNSKRTDKEKKCRYKFVVKKSGEK